MTRVMFKCTSVEKVEGWGGREFLYNSKFSAVSEKDGDDASKFFAATPNGSLTVQAVIENHFTPGKTYYLDFQEVEDSNTVGS